MVTSSLAALLANLRQQFARAQVVPIQRLERGPDLLRLVRLALLIQGGGTIKNRLQRLEPIAAGRFLLKVGETLLGALHPIPVRLAALERRGEARPDFAGAALVALLPQTFAELVEVLRLRGLR